MRAVVTITCMLSAVIVPEVRPPRAEVRYSKRVRLRAEGAAKLTVMNRLGSVRLSGWDKDFMEVTAIKQAESRVLGERLRVGVTRTSSTVVEIRTYLQMFAPPHASMKQVIALLSAQRAQLSSTMPRIPGQILADYVSKLSGTIAAYEQDLARAQSPGNDALGLSVPLSAGRVDLEVQVPRSMHVVAQTFRHDIDVDGFGGNVDLMTEEGAVRVAEVHGALVTRVQRGSQHVVRVRGPVEIVGGDSNVVLRDIKGPVQAVLVSGDIDARGVDGPRVVLRTVFGDIELTGGAPADAQYFLVARTGKLSILVDDDSAFSVRGSAHASEIPPSLRHLVYVRDGNQLAGRIGHGGGVLHLRSDAGTVKFIVGPAASSGTTSLRR